MKKYLITFSILLCTVLAACSQEEPTLVGIRFERGHGSTWGSQFYMDVRTDEIAAASYFPEGSADQVSLEHVPISARQWQLLTEAVQNLQLQEARGAWRKRLFGKSKTDGGEYRNLILIWETKNGTKQTEYQWPQSEEADALEALLEQLAETAS